ncbi:MAG: hypothetical protein HQ527_02170 [Cyanobacteria bacterium]|nr:hypothetical protein [Cyanobacteria bacterium bin.51]
MNTIPSTTHSRLTSGRQGRLHPAERLPSARTQTLLASPAGSGTCGNTGDTPSWADLLGER